MDVYFNSQDGYGTPENFQMVGLSFDNHGAEFELTFKQAIFLNLRPTLIKGENNVFAIRHNGTTYNIEFVEDYYDGVSIATTLQTALTTTTGGAYTVTFGAPNAPTYCLAITPPAGSTFEILATTVQVTKRFVDVIGMRDQVSRVTSGGTKLVGMPVALSGSKYVDVQFRVNQPCIHSGGLSDIVARIAIDQPYGNLITTQAQIAGPTKSVTIGNFSTLNFALYDEWGNYFRLPKNQSVSLVFSLTAAGSSDYAV
jgi:hypothetical protein